MGRMLKSVVVNANDAILITEAEPIDPPGPRIVFANEAFTRMTGHGLEEIIGKTPRILQGPNTERAQLDKIREHCRRQLADLPDVLRGTNAEPVYPLIYSDALEDEAVKLGLNRG